MCTRIKEGNLLSFSRSTDYYTTSVIMQVFTHAINASQPHGHQVWHEVNSVLT